MADFRIAHIRQQGQDIIIVPMDSQFQFRTQEQKAAAKVALQRCATAAGLAGTVCLVWTYGRNFYFIAPQPWHPFFKSLNMAAVARNINKRLTCDFG